LSDAGAEGSDRFDVLGLGAVAIDELLYVATYPPADAKARVLGRARQCGGLTGTALVAAARLGARSAYAGVLGDDAPSGFAVDNFLRAGIDVSWLRRRPGVGPILSTIVIGREDASRTVLSDRNGFVGPDVDWPPEAVIRSARVLFVDHLGVPGMTRAARIAREAGRAVVADFERATDPGFAGLLELADHLIVGQAFAAQLTGESDPASAARALWVAGRSNVVVTAGDRGCWAIEGPDATDAHHQPAFAVAVVDTTGCGDVFHGAYAASLARGAPLAARLRLASAAAALKATRPGGQAGIPDRSTLSAFLDEVTPVAPGEQPAGLP
jgi:sugar/nucleoside kinase (ribokinase family)